MRVMDGRHHTAAGGMFDTQSSLWLKIKGMAGLMEQMTMQVTCDHFHPLKQ